MEGRCGSQTGDKISEGYKDKETYKSATCIYSIKFEFGVLSDFMCLCQS